MNQRPRASSEDTATHFPAKPNAGETAHSTDDLFFDISTFLSDDASPFGAVHQSAPSLNEPRRPDPTDNEHTAQMQSANPVLPPPPSPFSFSCSYSESPFYSPYFSQSFPQSPSTHQIFSDFPSSGFDCSNVASTGQNIGGNHTLLTEQNRAAVYSPGSTTDTQPHTPGTDLLVRPGAFTDLPTPLLRRVDSSSSTASSSSPIHTQPVTAKAKSSIEKLGQKLPECVIKSGCVMETFFIPNISPQPSRFINMDLASKYAHIAAGDKKELGYLRQGTRGDEEQTSSPRAKRLREREHEHEHEHEHANYINGDSASVTDTDVSGRTIREQDPESPKQPKMHRRGPRIPASREVGEKVLDIDYRPDTKTKRPINAFMAYMTYMRDLYKREGRLIDNKEFIKQMSANWRTAPDEFQKSYWDLARELTKLRNDELAATKKANAITTAPVQLGDYSLCEDAPNTFVWSPAEYKSPFENRTMPLVKANGNRL